MNTQFEVGFGTPKYISEEFHKKIIQTETKLNDILIVKDGATTGKIGIIESEKCINQNINEHVFLLRSDSEKIDQHYLCYYLHSPIGQLEIKKEITGATVTGISKTSVKNLRIPLPPLSKQIEITDHIKEIRSQAKQLEIDSEQILLDAKKEIEKMILGE